MVKINQYLKRAESVSTGNLPLLNSLFVDRFSELSPSKDNDFKTFMKWTRRSPQLMGFINIIATDILSDKIDFKPLKKESGRNKVLKAEKFWEDNHGVEVTEPTLYDLLVLGIGYNWLGKISDMQLKEMTRDVLLNLDSNLEKKELEFKADDLINSIKKNSGDKVVKKLRHVAASTMSIKSDEHEITGYTQRVGVNIRRFTTEEILTFQLMPFDGKIYPFPPMEAILSEIYLLWLINQNYVSFFENGGKPDNVFILPKEIAGSKNHEYLINTLKKYKKIQNKHGNMVFTGDLSIEKLMEVEHQMENKDLGLYLVGILAMFYGVPVSRIPFLVGKSATSGDSGGLADSGYWRKISVWQSKLEAVYNREIWKPYFGVEMKFRRGYLQDEVRETSTDMQKTSIAEQRIRLGLWTTNGAGEYLGIDEEEIKLAQEEKKTRDEAEMRSGMQNQNLESLDNSIKNQDAKMKAKKKQDTQLKNKQDNGGKTIKP